MADRFRYLGRRGKPNQARSAEEQVFISIQMPISPRSLITYILLVIATLSMLGLASAYLLYVGGHMEMRFLWNIFMLDRESNVPTFFSFSLLVFAAALLGAISAQQDQWQGCRRPYWVVLAGLFLLMAFDESTSLHERLISPVRHRLDTGGLLYFAWVIPGGVFVAVMFLGYARFLLTLPKPFPQLFVLSGMLYIGGALGVEMFGGAYAERHGMENFTYHSLASLEETLEMVGLAVFLYTLARFLQCAATANKSQVTVAIGGGFTGGPLAH